MDHKEDFTAEFQDFSLKDTSECLIETPDGEPMLFKGHRVAVHLYGPSTDQFVNAKAELDREINRRTMAAAMHAANGKKNKSKEAEDRDADAKFLVAVTARVDNFPFPGGPGGIYRELRLKYIADQVRAHLNDQANFFKPSATA